MSPAETVISLRLYIEKQFELRDAARAREREQDDRATGLAMNSLEHRLKLLNELRGNVVSQDEFKITIREMRAKVESLEKFQARLVGMGIILAMLSGGVGAVLSKIFGG